MGTIEKRERRRILINHPVRAAQQRFWPDAQPLVERFGRDFFLQLPERPGVYLMRGAEEVVLYVGKAKNLRRRLNCYRVANPERMPRRILRLLQRVETICIEECPDEPAALQREAQLLLDLKPRFNRAGVWKGPPWFLAWRRHPNGFELVATKTPEEGWQQIGPMGSQATCLHQALVRLLWLRLQPERGLAGMPAGWFRGSHGRHVLIPQSDSQLLADTDERIAALAAGRLAMFEAWFSRPTHPFEQLAFDEDFSFVTDCFDEKLTPLD